MKTLVQLYNTTVTLLQKLNWLPPLLARVAVGVVFAESGWGKLHNIQKVIEFFTSLGIPAPEAQAYFVSSTELVCGLLILFGLLTRLASVPLIVVMIVALITAKKESIAEFTDLFGMPEYLYIVLLIALVIGGAGRLSLDHAFKKFRS